MNLAEMEKKVEELVGSDTVHEMKEEQKTGKELLLALRESLGAAAVTDWLYGKYEEALVPIRLPKGMAELLKQADEKIGEVYNNDRCGDCKKNKCLLLRRNPSEVLLTVALKSAFVFHPWEPYDSPMGD